MDQAHRILAEALEALAERADIAHEHLVLEPTAAGTYQADAHVTLSAPLGRYRVEVKRHITPTRLGPIMAQIKNLVGDEPLLLVTDYVTLAVGEKLRAHGIQFIDTAGNAYLYRNKPFIHVWMIGNKPATAIAHKTQTLFRAKGLQVLFPLLCLPEAVNAPYRQIAEWADVALGTVANTMAQLERLEYVRDTRQGRIITDRAKLMDRWVEAYPMELRPRLHPRRFTVLHPAWWQEFGLHDYERYGIWLGGEVAAGILTHYLHPVRTTVYGRPDFKRFAKRVIQPMRDENGDFELLEPFWNFQTQQLDETHRLCPPLLIYADLVTTAESRMLDAAQLIRERFLDET